MAIACGLGAASPASANHIRASLIAEKPAAPGGAVTLALLMQPEPGWHGYWLNPGDAGYGLALDWTLPAGAKTGTPQFPVPQTLLIAGLMNHVYEHDYAVLVPLTLPADAAPGTVLPLHVKARWLACTREVCVPEQADLAGSVAVGGGTIAADARFTGWRTALPAPIDRKGAFALTPQALRLAIPFPAASRIEAPHLFVATENIVSYAAPQRFWRKGDTLIVELARAPGVATPPPPIVSGVLAIGGAAGGLAIDAQPGVVPTDGTPLDTTAARATPLGLLAVIGAALLGGLILNVMPCVFPILSLKALALARSNAGEAAARREGLAYAAGVICACLALGGTLLALRGAGAQVGWAFQLQEPGVVAVLLLLAVAITANFMGVFEVPGLSFERGGHTTGGAFATGLLAAFVATPCTGPFMAAAIGAALVLPLWAALATFAALGLGIALPFVALGFVPALRRLLPRPGAWMERFRRAMAVPMGLTALALAWLAWRLGGQAFAGLAILSAVALVLVLFAVGRAQRAAGSSPRWVLPAAALIVVAAAAGVPLAAVAPPAEGPGLLDAQAFSELALTRARAGGKPVFVYFTADWCLSCKVNESVAIEREGTRDAFRKAGVTVLRGDWTRRDEAITRFLTAQGAAGVPLYLWYPKGGDEPRQLPQVLGPDTLAALARAG
ncbi:protein-disulfide reductase DsbD family protein [Novosphingobium lentum]|uniref:protein-disulfide reductase DsbD family protein n=1 Tax=Novosphingobium lentum TaxID=145287 RepID=UPI0034E2A4EF